MSVGSNEERVAKAKKKVTELTAKGYRLAKGTGSQHYREQVEQPKNAAGSKSAAEEIAERLRRGG